VPISRKRGRIFYSRIAAITASRCADAASVWPCEFIVAAKAVAEQVTQEQLDTGLIYPHQSQIFEASIHVAVKVAERIFENNLAGIPRPADLEAHIREWAYHPEYPPYE
jgi:malate dehydrogenase (oxaloacetate-decarboxylating)(NADP+)